MFFFLKGRYKKEIVLNQKVFIIGIYFLLYGELFESVGVVMNVGKIKEIEVFMEVVDGLCELRNDYIKFFIIVVEIIVVFIVMFMFFFNFLNIVGVIDGIYIKIKVLKDSVVDYFSCY